MWRIICCLRCTVKNGRCRWNLLVFDLAAAAVHRRMANRWNMRLVLPAAESVRSVYRGADAAHQSPRTGTQVTAHLRAKSCSSKTSLLIWLIARVILKQRTMEAARIASCGY